MVDNNQQIQMETDNISCSKKSNWSQKIAELVKLVNCFNNDGKLFLLTFRLLFQHPNKYSSFFYI